MFALLLLWNQKKLSCLNSLQKFSRINAMQQLIPGTNFHSSYLVSHTLSISLKHKMTSQSNLDMYHTHPTYMKSCSEQGFRVVEDKYDSLFKFSILPSTSIAQENPATTNCLQLMHQQNL